MDKCGSKCDKKCNGKCHNDKCDHSHFDCPPHAPRTRRELLCSLVGEQVTVTTPFAPITGTLIAVRCDYIVIIEGTGEQVLVRIDSVVLVNPLPGGGI
ncbi:DUF2642 domain-containing protein [Lentibacillus sediminis]|uniref:DUF2642 domain-containing protein n=1 Tax=Lentibacillus sediminis TaxID=1940529 RepID=UPI003B8468BD